MVNCVSCGIATHRSNAIKSVPLNDETVLSIIRARTGLQTINNADCVCSSCWNLLNDTLRSEHHETSSSSTTMVGHRSVCVLCGRSVLRTRFHPLNSSTEREARIYNVICKWIMPRTVQLTSRLCHPCWMRADRASRHFVSGPSTSSSAPTVEESPQIPTEDPPIQMRNVVSGASTQCFIEGCQARERNRISLSIKKDEEAGICDENMDDAEDDTNTLVESNVEEADICDDNMNNAEDDSNTPVESNDEEAVICDDNMDDAEDDTNTLVESNVCRVCLAMDVKMYDLKDTELRVMFQNVTGICVPENNHSILERLCWECVGRLKTAAAFRNKALVSDTLLQGLANTGEQIRKNDITTIKENKEYLRPAGTLSVVEVFHPVDIDPENDSEPHILENNDTNIVEHTVGKDSREIKKENIIDEDGDQLVIKDEPMIEYPIKTETEYDQFDYLYPNTGEDSRNVFTKTNPLVGNDISLSKNKISLPDSSPLPGCSHADPKYPVVGSLQNTLNNCKDKIKTNAILVINKKDLNAKIVFKKPKVLRSDKSKNINVNIGGVSKKILIINEVTKTQVNTHTGEECQSLKDVQF